MTAHKALMTWKLTDTGKIGVPVDSPLPVPAQAARAPLVEEVARLKAELDKTAARVDDYERLHQADAERIAYLETEGRELRAKLEATEKLSTQRRDRQVELSIEFSKSQESRGDDMTHPMSAVEPPEGQLR